MSLEGVPPSPSYLFLLLPQTVPHGGHDLGNFSKRSVGVLSLDSGLCVPEEQRVGRHRFLRLVGVFPLLLLLPFPSSSCSSFPSHSRRDAGGRGGERGVGQRGVKGDDSGRDGQRDRRFDQDALEEEKDED